MNEPPKDESLELVEKSRFHAEWCAAEGKVLKNSPLTGNSKERIKRVSQTTTLQFEAVVTSNINSSAKDIVLDFYIEDGMEKKKNERKTRDQFKNLSIGIASNAKLGYISVFDFYD